ncbi:MAG: hypothetical protein V7K88_02915 [Nostoc sp.]|uniref:hypothetical protein n=1 Tax=Nostoc sp. TaxID=1180 RepID=UPI002FFAD95D
MNMRQTIAVLVYVSYTRRGTALPIGVNYTAIYMKIAVSANFFKTSFPASGWKRSSIAALPRLLRRSLQLGIPSQRLGTRQGTPVGARQCRAPTPGDIMLYRI